MLQWSLVNRFGILRDPSQDTWNAGHVNDVVELADGQVLVASDGGGVWHLGPGFGLPLSMDWEAGDTHVLAGGPDGPDHFFAGGVDATGHGLLWQTDLTAPFPLWTWRGIELPPDAGLVQNILVEPIARRIVLATTNPWYEPSRGGVWTSPIPASDDPGGFHWASANGLWPGASATGLAAGPAGTVLVGADGTIFNGAWRRGRLDLTPAPIAADGTFTPFVVIASSPSDPNVAYASGADGSVSAVLRVEGRHGSWRPVAAIDRGTGAVIVDHSQGGYTGALAVSPFDPQVVVLGYTDGPWVSVDGGDSFFPVEGLSHDDKHRYRFTATGRLYEACDGGLFYTDDLPGLRAGAPENSLVSMVSSHNRQLANLQFLGPSGAVRGESWGRTNASASVPGLIGGGLQDNNDVYSMSWPSGASTPWQAVPPDWEYDGKAISFLPDGSVLFSYGDIRIAHWTSSTLLAADPDPIQVRDGKPGINYVDGGLPAGTIAQVPFPDWRNANGKLMFAVASPYGYAPPAGSPADAPGPPYTPDLYGLFSEDDGSDKHWGYLATLPLDPESQVSAIGTATGHQVLIGTIGVAQLWHVDADSGFISTPGTGLPPRATEPFGGQVLDIEVSRTTGEAFTIVTFPADESGAIGGVLCHSADGLAWTVPAAEGLPDAPLYCLARSTGDGVLYVATDSSVYISGDAGGSFNEESTGLPRLPHCSDLFVARLPAGDERLYLSTYGWSVWSTVLGQATIPSKNFRPYPFLYPDDAPRPVVRTRRLNDLPRPALNAPDVKGWSRPGPGNTPA